MWVVKIGGSLINDASEILEEIVGELWNVHKIKDIAAVAGGGSYADLIRKLGHNYSIGNRGSHWLAILAMHLNAYCIESSWPNYFSLSTQPKPEPGKPIPIFLPYSPIKESDLPQSWEVTSDTISAYLANTLNSKLLLLKSVDGLTNQKSKEIIKSLTAKDLSGHRQSLVDEYLPIILRKHGLEAWIVNGHHPKRIHQLLVNGRTYGTHIYSESSTITS